MAAVPGDDEAKRRRVEEEAPPAPVKQEETEAPPPEQEQDAKKETRPLLGQEVHVDLRDCTLNVVPTLGGRVLAPLTDGGLQYLVAGARANVGVRKGRYIFEVKIVEALNPFEPAASRSARAPMPRQLVRVGFSTQDSSLFLGETEESVCFDSEGFFTADKKRSATSQRFGRDQTIAVLLNVDKKSGSPNANTVSLFRDGVRISQPQALPDNLLDKALYPHVNFKNVTLEISFGPTPLAPLPFQCRTWEEVAKDDAEVRKHAGAVDGKYEVIFPVGLPDEGTFDWLDGFLQKNPQYTEVSDRTVLRWAERSGLWRPNPTVWKNSNDKPEMNFGIPLMDDNSIRRVLGSVVATQPRNYVVMEVKSNLMKEERQELLKKFFDPCYKKVAMVVVGEPDQEFKAKVQDSTLKEKQVQLEQEHLRKKLDKERRKAQQRQAEESRRKMEEERKAYEGEMRTEEREEEVKKEEEEEEKKEVKEEGAPESEDEPMPTAELSEEERKRWFRKKAVPDLTMWVLSTSFQKFTLPQVGDGFDEVRYAWQQEAGCHEYMKDYVRRQKVLTRIEDLQVCDWFRIKWNDWQTQLADWHRRQSEWRTMAQQLAAEKAMIEAATRQQEAERGILQEEDPGDEGGEKKEQKDKEKAEEYSLLEVQDVCNTGKGEPLFSKFEFEDWALMSLRLELHLLVHAFQKDITDPERVGIHESNLPFYYNKYYRKSFNVKNYGVDTNPALVDLIKDTVMVNPVNGVLEPQLPSELDNYDAFVKLTEEARRERTRRLDAGDETVKLKFSKPEAPQQQQKGGMLSSQQDGRMGSGPPKGGKGYYSRGQSPYGGKGPSYCWGGKSGGYGGLPGTGGKGYGGYKGSGYDKGGYDKGGGGYDRGAYDRGGYDKGGGGYGKAYGK